MLISGLLKSDTTNNGIQPQEALLRSKYQMLQVSAYYNDYY
jgi:hypothetical protein